MNQLFDKYDLYETPTFILCNPNRTQLYALGEIYDRKIELRYNAVSKLYFSAPAIVNGNSVAYFEYLDYRRLIYVEDIGYFTIVEINETNDGKKDIKEIVAYSAEFEFNNKKVSLFEGTYKFYDYNISYIGTGATFLDIVLSYLPGWAVGTVSGELLTKYRTFDLSDTTLYNLLMVEAEQAYQCVFDFDTVTKTVNAYSISEATHSSDVFLSYDNLVEEVSLKTATEEMVTALSVYGGGDLSINTVNPLGGDIIYNFNYYETTQWMSQGLIDALDVWEALIVANQPTYANLLTTLKNYNATLVNQQTALTDLKNERTALEGVRKARIQQGLDISAITAQINAKTAQIKAKKAQIVVTQANITTTTEQLQAINTLLDFESNFTDAQLLELDPYILGSTYQNDNFIQTDIMTNEEIQDMAQGLYDQAVGILTGLASPRYSFEINSVNFVFLKEFDDITNQLDLGDVVTVEIRDGVYAYPVLLGIDLNYDDPTDFALKFNTRLRLNDAAYSYTDLFDQIQSQTISTGFNSKQWSNFDTNYKDEVSVLINDALDASKNNVVNAINQDIIIDENGLRGRQFISDEEYQPTQVWLVNNMLAFTKDNWDTASLALGQISTSSGSFFGLVAQVLVGNIIAGNQLTISNENNTFTLDGSGATLTNATLSVVANENKNRILLDPYNGFRIQKYKTSGSPGWIDKFYADLDGNVNFTGLLKGASGDFSGKITANEGSIGGFTISSNGLYLDSGHYLKSTGDLKWGKLSLIGDTAIWDGNFYAKNLLGLVQSNQIGSVNADTINAGTIRGINIYGSNIYWPGVQMGAGGETGTSQLTVDKSMQIIRDASNITINENGISLISGASISLLPDGQRIFINGLLTTMDTLGSKGYGVSEQFVVNTTSGTKQLSFINGLLCTGNPPTGGSGTFFSEFGWSFIIPLTATGIVGFIEIPFACTFQSVRMVGDAVGSCVVNIYKRNYAYWGTAYDTSITASTPPTITASAVYQDYNLTNWTKSFSKGDYLVISVSSYSTITQVTLSIKGVK